MHSVVSSPLVVSARALSGSHRRTWSPNQPGPRRAPPARGRHRTGTTSRRRQPPETPPHAPHGRRRTPTPPAPPARRYRSLAARNSPPPTRPASCLARAHATCSSSNHSLSNGGPSLSVRSVYVRRITRRRRSDGPSRATVATSSSAAVPTLAEVWTRPEPLPHTGHDNHQPDKSSQERPQPAAPAQQQRRGDQRHRKEECPCQQPAGSLLPVHEKHCPALHLGMPSLVAASGPESSLRRTQTQRTVGAAIGSARWW